MTEIGISALPLDYPHSGTATYLRNLLLHLPETAPDLTYRAFVRWSEERFPGVLRDRLLTPAAPLNRGAGAGAQMDKFLWETGSLPTAAGMRRVALLHSPTFAAPLVSPVPLVVTVHDLIPLVLPGYHRTRQSALYSRFMARTVRAANRIIAVSAHARRDIITVLRYPEDRISVVYEAAGDSFRPDGSPDEQMALRARYGLPGRFVLYLGGAERRKNIETVVRAWARLRAAHHREEIVLVLVADFPRPDPLYADIPALIRELGLEHAVVCVRSVDERDKPALYRAAELFCFPSLYEGFGLPPLEAMASGTPVLCSDATSLPEVVGDAAWLLPPSDPAAWAEAIATLLRSGAERARLRERGLARASSFSWRVAAEQTAAIYREVVGA